MKMNIENLRPIDILSEEKEELFDELYYRLAIISNEHKALFSSRGGLIDELEDIKMSMYNDMRLVRQLPYEEIADYFNLTKEVLKRIEVVYSNMISFNQKRSFIFKDYFPESFMDFKAEVKAQNKQEDINTFTNEERPEDINKKDSPTLGQILNDIGIAMLNRLKLEVRQALKKAQATKKTSSNSQNTCEIPNSNLAPDERR